MNMFGEGNGGKEENTFGSWVMKHKLIPTCWNAITTENIELRFFHRRGVVVYYC